MCRLLLMAHFLVPAMLQAQEVSYIDLTGVQQRTELRHPPVFTPFNVRAIAYHLYRPLATAARKGPAR
jgi:hypothetical protein